MAKLNYEDVVKLIDNVCRDHEIGAPAYHHLRGALADLNALTVVADKLAETQQQLEEIVYTECYRHLDISEKGLSFDAWLECKTSCTNLYYAPYTKEDVTNILKGMEQVNKDYEEYLEMDDNE